MTTYVTLRNRITEELIDSAVTASHINSAIKSAIKDYEREPFWFNTKVATLSTVAAQELYTSTELADIPDIVRIDAVRLTSASGAKIKLAPIDNNFIEEMQDGTVTGQPQKYSRYADKLRFYPIPNAVHVVTLSYVYKLTELSADTDTNAWTDECEEMIRQAAKRILCTDILHSDEMGTRYLALESRAYDKIREENRQRSPAQYLRTDFPFGGRGYVDLTGDV